MGFCRFPGQDRQSVDAGRDDHPPRRMVVSEVEFVLASVSSHDEGVALMAILRNGTTVYVHGHGEVCLLHLLSPFSEKDDCVFLGHHQKALDRGELMAFCLRMYEDRQEATNSLENETVTKSIPAFFLKRAE